MITKININGVACYREMATLETDKHINLLYGLNGSGKSTQVKLLHKYFLENGKASILTKGIGGGGEFCMEIRRILCTTKSIDNLTELFLLYASRNEHVKNVLLPAIKEGKHIVCDRYVDSSYAYQCNGNAEMVALLKTFHSIQ